MCHLLVKKKKHSSKLSKIVGELLYYRREDQFLCVLSVLIFVMFDQCK